MAEPIRTNKIGLEIKKRLESIDSQQAQINELVVNGDSSPQAAQASVGADNTDYGGNLKARLDAEYNVTHEKIDQNQADTAAQLADKVIQAVNVTRFGAVSDGSTPCDAALVSAKAQALNKSLYFPQNTSNNAVYYFSGSPLSGGSLDGYKIYADPGVQLSVSTMNGVAPKNIIFINKVDVHARDRNNTTTQYPQPDDFTNIAMTDNPMGLGFKEPKIINLNDGTLVEQSLLTDNSTDNYTYFYSYSAFSYANGYVIATAPTPSDKLTLFHTLSIASLSGCAFRCAFKSANGTGETSSDLRLGVVAYKDQNNFMYVSLGGDKKLYVGTLDTDNSQLFVETSKDLSGVLTDAYLPTGDGFDVTVRQTKTREFEVYINGYSLGKFTTSFNINYIGGAINHLYVASNSGKGIWNWALCNPMYEFLEDGYIGNNLKIASFGDSFMQSEGTSISFVDYLKKYLKGQRGITSVKTLDNFAASGETAAQQYARMQSDLTADYGTVLIMVGENDVQMQTNISTFQNTIASMIDLAKSFGAKVIVGIPPQFISQSLTGVGFASSNFQKGVAYRECIKYIARSKGVTIADVASEIGRVGIDTALDILRDNLHPNSLTQMVIAKCFSRSIIKAYTTTVGVGEIYDNQPIIISPSLQNSWVNYGSTYDFAKVIKEKSGKVTLSGLIHGGVTNTATVLFNLPNGFRPNATLMLPVISNNGSTINGSIEVRSNGDVAISTSVGNSWFSLNTTPFFTS
jgi:lysophospholipase L1-like esterase